MSQPATDAQQQQHPQEIAISNEDREAVLLDIFQQLPTNFLLGAMRLATRDFKRVLESDRAQKHMWHKRASHLEIVAQDIARKCAAEKVVYESHRDAESRHRTTFTPLDRCLHYYSRALLWQTQHALCAQWYARYYTSSGEMHRYWYEKHARSTRIGETFNETNTELALKTVSTSRAAAMSAAVEMYSNIPFTPPT